MHIYTDLTGKITYNVSIVYEMYASRILKQAAKQSEQIYQAFKKYVMFYFISTGTKNTQHT